ncbi:DnaJ C-terminal domain-containing protein [Paracoccus sp. p3-h83]
MRKMDKSPYDILGVSQSASEAEIKKAYRKLAKDNHPDLNPGDAGAAERFKAASAAYDLLKDPEMRARFDRGEVDASGQERPQRQYYRDHAGAGAGANPYGEARHFQDFGDMSDVFADLFGARAQARQGRSQSRGSFDMPGPDHRYGVEIDFLTAVQGGAVEVILQGGQPLKVTIPAGATDGQTIRLRGKGGAGMGAGPAGDAYLTLSVRDHPTFSRDGDDILTTLPISLDEAILGAKVEVATIAGPVAVNIPKGASSGQTLRLRGRGVAGRGDQRIELKIVMPKTIDDDLARFIESWRKNHGYDPRKGGRA